MLLSSLSKVGGKGDFAEQIATPHTKCPETLPDFYVSNQLAHVPGTYVWQCL